MLKNNSHFILIMQNVPLQHRGYSQSIKNKLRIRYNVDGLILCIIMGDNMIKLRMLPALGGDCIMLRFLDQDFDYMVMIDSGMGRECIRKLKTLVHERSINSALDLWILTHIDSDHISGILHLLQDESINGEVIRRIWFNYGKNIDDTLQVFPRIELRVADISEKTSYRQGNELYSLLKKRNIQLQAPLQTGDVYELGPIRITVLSPSTQLLKKMISSPEYSYENDDYCSSETSGKKNDYKKSIEELTNKKFNEDVVSVTNASSIAVLLEYKKRSLLLLGDAKASEVESALRKKGFSEINRLRVDYCKVAHHGSAHNTSDSLVRIIDCKNYLISSNWKNGKPSKECLSRIVINSPHKVTFYCNYKPCQEMFSTDERKQYGMSFNYVGDKEFEIYVK